MKIIFFLFFLISSLGCFAQNLVPNGDFEKYDTCPNDWMQLSFCQNWSSFRGDPDYYNSCSTNWDIKPPNTFFGFQFPHSGVAYASLYTYQNPESNNRELMGSPLNSQLLIGQKYYISFYISLGGYHSSTVGTNKMGIKFSTVPYSETNPATINNFAHYYSDSIITDTLNWVCIRGSFIADSSYSYIIIGNFFVDSLTNTINSSYAHIAFYFIDDICVSTDSLYCENWVGVNEQSENREEEITIYPNPAYNNVSVSSKNGENIKHIVITDLTGRQVYSNNYGTGSIETEMNILFLQPGNYFVTIATSENIHTEKLVIVK